MNQSGGPKLYQDLASWWPLLSAPFEYEEEAEVYRRLLQDVAFRRLDTVLELGCGGGNNASHLKTHYEMTLTDISPQMLEVSRKLNPECEHVEGDMRSLRLERVFDAVFVHDAIGYMTTEQDLAAAMRTIAEHCEPNGAVLVAADEVAETYEDSTDHGGNDGEGRSIRYLQWSHDMDPETSTYLMDFAYLIKENGNMRVEHDRHVCGVFSRNTWLRLMNEAGLDMRNQTHTFSDGFTSEIFVGNRR